MLKPFIVTLETAVVVMAEDARAAEQWTKKNFHKLNDDVSAYNFDYSAARMDYYPGDWSKDCLPYGTTDDTLLGEILEKDEVFQARRKEMQEISEKFKNR